MSVPVWASLSTQNDPMGEAAELALVLTISEAEMDDHAEGQERGKTRAKLDWPTPEMLAAAHRARGLFLRDLVLALVRRLKAPASGHLLVARPVKVRLSNRR